jgi:peptidoglycan/xylan/chitin deacetylase (PgdA/CDA1 family)
MLNENKAKATFFLLGRNITGREKIVRQITERGHEICSHGFDHLNYLKVSPWRALTDIKKGWKAIDTALGVNRGKYPFRPPYGKLNIICLLYLLIKKVPIIYWTDDSGDTWKSRPNSDRIAVLVKNSGGTVSLIHDFNRSGEKVESWVLESVRLALTAVKGKGMRTLTVSELLDGTK